MTTFDNATGCTTDDAMAHMRAQMAIMPLPPPLAAAVEAFVNMVFPADINRGERRTVLKLFRHAVAFDVPDNVIVTALADFPSKACSHMGPEMDIIDYDKRETLNCLTNRLLTLFRPSTTQTLRVYMTVKGALAKYTAPSRTYPAGEPQEGMHWNYLLTHPVFTRKVLGEFKSQLKCTSVWSLLVREKTACGHKNMLELKLDTTTQQPYVQMNLAYALDDTQQALLRQWLYEDSDTYDVGVAELALTMDISFLHSFGPVDADTLVHLDVLFGETTMLVE